MPPWPSGFATVPRGTADWAISGTTGRAPSRPRRSAYHAARRRRRSRPPVSSGTSCKAVDATTERVWWSWCGRRRGSTAHWGAWGADCASVPLDVPWITHSSQIVADLLRVSSRNERPQSGSLGRIYGWRLVGSWDWEWGMRTSGRAVGPTLGGNGSIPPTRRRWEPAWFYCGTHCVNPQGPGLQVGRPTTRSRAITWSCPRKSTYRNDST